MIKQAHLKAHLCEPFVYTASCLLVYSLFFDHAVVISTKTKWQISRYWIFDYRKCQTPDIQVLLESFLFLFL